MDARLVSLVSLASSGFLASQNGEQKWWFVRNIREKIYSQNCFHSIGLRMSSSPWRHFILSVLDHLNFFRGVSCFVVLSLMLESMVDVLYWLDWLHRLQFEELIAMSQPFSSLENAGLLVDELDLDLLGNIPNRFGESVDLPRGLLFLLGESIDLLCGLLDLFGESMDIPGGLLILFGESVDLLHGLLALFGDWVGVGLPCSMLTLSGNWLGLFLKALAFSGEVLKKLPVLFTGDSRRLPGTNTLVLSGDWLFSLPTNMPTPLDDWLVLCESPGLFSGERLKLLSGNWLFNLPTIMPILFGDWLVLCECIGLFSGEVLKLLSGDWLFNLCIIIPILLGDWLVLPVWTGFFSGDELGLLDKIPLFCGDWLVLLNFWDTFGDSCLILSWILFPTLRLNLIGSSESLECDCAGWLMELLKKLYKNKQFVG